MIRTEPELRRTMSICRRFFEAAETATVQPTVDQYILIQDLLDQCIQYNFMSRAGIVGIADGLGDSNVHPIDEARKKRERGAR